MLLPPLSICDLLVIMTKMYTEIMIQISRLNKISIFILTSFAYSSEWDSAGQ